MKLVTYLNLKQLALLLLFVPWGSCLWAHPVSYAGATSIMTWASTNSTDWMLTHSFTTSRALSYHFMRMRDHINPEVEDKFHLLSGNFLLKRWNQLESQGNVYFSIGGGEEVKRKIVGYASVDLDWESRDYYVSHKTEIVARQGGNKNFLRSKVRAGFAPYRGGFEELNTWIITEVEKESDSKKEYDATPFVRFYYRNILTEAGVSLNGEYKFNFMVHF